MSDGKFRSAFLIPKAHRFEILQFIKNQPKHIKRPKTYIEVIRYLPEKARMTGTGAPNPYQEFINLLHKLLNIWAGSRDNDTKRVKLSHNQMMTFEKMMSESCAGWRSEALYCACACDTKKWKAYSEIHMFKLSSSTKSAKIEQGLVENVQIEEGRVELAFCSFVPFGAVEMNGRRCSTLDKALAELLRDEDRWFFGGHPDASGEDSGSEGEESLQSATVRSFGEPSSSPSTTAHGSVCSIHQGCPLSSPELAIQSWTKTCLSVIPRVQSTHLRGTGVISSAMKLILAQQCPISSRRLVATVIVLRVV